jgi:hypothetical protein
MSFLKTKVFITVEPEFNHWDDLGGKTLYPITVFVLKAAQTCADFDAPYASQGCIIS